MRKLIKRILAGAMSFAVLMSGRFIPRLEKTDMLPVEMTVCAADGKNENLVSDILTYEETLSYRKIDENADGTFDYIMITKCISKYAITVDIPKEIDNLPVRVIGSEAFAANNFLMEVNIPSSVRHIQSYAFIWCTSLNHVELSEGLLRIDIGAFINCPSLESIKIPSSVLEINDKPFGYITESKVQASKVENFKLEVYEDSEGKKYAEKYGFEYTELKQETKSDYNIKLDYRLDENRCAYIEVRGGDLNSGKWFLYIYPMVIKIVKYNGSEEKVEIPSEFYGIPVTKIGAAFSGNQNIKEVIINEGVEEIGSNAFFQCQNLESVSIPDSVKRVGVDAFTVTKLKEDQWEKGENVLYVGKWLVDCDPYYLRDSDTIEIREGTVGIADYAISGGTFYNNDGTVHEMQRQSLNLPDSLKYFGQSAFSGSGITELNISENVDYIGDYAFTNCKNLESISVSENNKYYASVNGILFNKNQDKILCFPAGSKIDEYEISVNIKAVSISSFEGNQNLKKLTISGDISDAVEWGNFKSLETIDVSENHRSFTSENGILFSKSKRYLYLYPAGKKDTEYVIPEYVERIYSGAFYGCENLTKVTIPENVTYIGSSAFENCISLPEITIPGSVTGIGSNAFKGCKNLSDVTILEGVTKIGYDAFRYCDNIVDITIPESVIDISGAFSWCRGMKSITILNSECNIDSLASYPVKKGEPVELIIYGLPDSTAQKYAESYKDKKNYNFYFAVVGTEPVITTPATTAPIETTTVTTETTAATSTTMATTVTTTATSTTIATTTATTTATTATTTTAVTTTTATTAAATTTTTTTTTATTAATTTTAAATTTTTAVTTTTAATSTTAVVTSTTIATTATILTTTATTGTTVKLGDTDGDGVISMKDAIFIRRFVAGGWDLKLDVKTADIDGDGKISLKDAIMIRRYIAGGWEVKL